MKKRSGIGSVVKREFMRAMMERTQSLDLKQVMGAFGAVEPAVYDDVEEQLNIAYVNRDEVPLAMDMFKPKVPEGTELPVILLIHGGGLFMGDRGLNRPYSRLLAHKGYLVFSLEYRLAPKANICQQLDDVCAGMDRVGEMLVDCDVDFSRIFLVADSAGAYLACYVSAMHESVKLQKAIGHKPSRIVYAAVGFISGMFYTEKALQDQVYDEKRTDERFLKFMNVEHPDILSNVPPAFMVTSCGDMLNNYTLKFHKALKKAGRPSKLVYFGDEELRHIFPIMNPEHPKSIEATDKMLEWFEHWAQVRRESRKSSPELEQKQKDLQARIDDGSLARQKVWSNLKERVLVNESNLNRLAIIDCARSYTYADMFAEWDRYARVFSGLGICAENRSRAALCGVITAEPLFALYALNMTGAEVSLFSYPDFLPGGMWRTMLEKEHITDLIISDIMVTPEVWAEICAAKESLGLRHVILMHSLMGGAATGPAELVYNEYNYHSLKRRADTVFMEDLLKQYKDTPIRYDDSNGERTAFITHTSGTSGSRKLLPFTDMVFNKTLEMMPKGLHTFLEGHDNGKPLRCVQVFDISSIMALSGQVHTVFAQADTLVVTFFGFIHPKFVRALDFYNVDVIALTGFMVDSWLKRTDLDDLDLCTLKVVGLSGGYIPPEKMERYRAFFRAHGCTCDIKAAYGMSEAGGKPMFAPHDNKRDILGFAEDGDSIRIKDEQDGQFYRPEDGPRTGLLYMYSDVRSDNKLDGEVIFEYTQIDDRQYVCTNDLVQVNEDGSLSFAGRTDQFFVNNKGRKFDSGIVNRCLGAHSAVENCAVVPVMEKRINDTVPVLFVVPTEKGPGAAESIRKAFVDVYVKEKQIGADNLPTQFMLVNEIPLNANGKLDIFRITRQRLTGDAYDLVPIMENEELTDIQTKHTEQVNSFTAGTLPAGMENHSAYIFFDLFQTESTGGRDRARSPLQAFWPFSGADRRKKMLPKMPEEMWMAMIKYGNRLFGISIERKDYDFDFED